MSETTTTTAARPVVASHLADGEPVPAVKDLAVMIARGPRSPHTGEILRLNAAGTRAYVQLKYGGGPVRVALRNLETSPYA